MPDRYCSSCRMYREADTGASVKNIYGKVVRWRCYDCNLRAIHRCDELRGIRPRDEKHDNLNDK